MPHADAYPDLLRPPEPAGDGRRFVVSDRLPPEERIADAFLVPRVGAGWLYFLQADGRPQLPGGGKRPGETHRQALERELLRGIGAHLESFRLIGHWQEPSRPRLEDGDGEARCAVVASGFVRLVGPPLDGSEACTLEVRVSPLPAVASAFAADGRGDLADLYRLASALCA